MPNQIAHHNRVLARIRCELIGFSSRFRQNEYVRHSTATTDVLGTFRNFENLGSFSRPFREQIDSIARDARTVVYFAKPLSTDVRGPRMSQRNRLNCCKLRINCTLFIAKDLPGMGSEGFGVRATGTPNTARFSPAGAQRKMYAITVNKTNIYNCYFEVGEGFANAATVHYRVDDTYDFRLFLSLRAFPSRALTTTVNHLLDLVYRSQFCAGLPCEVFYYDLIFVPSTLPVFGKVKSPPPPCGVLVNTLVSRLRANTTHPFPRIINVIPKYLYHVLFKNNYCQTVPTHVTITFWDVLQLNILQTTST